MSNDIHLKGEIIRQIFVFKLLFLEIIIDRVGDFIIGGGGGSALEQASDLETEV